MAAVAKIRSFVVGGVFAELQAHDDAAAALAILFGGGNPDHDPFGADHRGTGMRKQRRQVAKTGRRCRNKRLRKRLCG